ncbi:hypothetical protein MSIBF_A1410019 [groundwater metagenome]|uniref:Uncharacterized protein n=1 Tax=groundwater metagenome TaxID=717931 RepID=A0A098E670_9ZZZZ
MVFVLMPIFLSLSFSTSKTIATITGIKKYEEVIKVKTMSKNGFEISDIILNRAILLISF